MSESFVNTECVNKMKLLYIYWLEIMDSNEYVVFAVKKDSTRWEGKIQLGSGALVFCDMKSAAAVTLRC